MAPRLSANGKPIGRPKKIQGNFVAVVAYVTESQKFQLQSLAQQEGEDLSEYLRHTIEKLLFVSSSKIQ